MAKVAKPDIKELKKIIKLLNKAELTDEIDLDSDDVDELAEDLVSAVEAVVDAQKGDDLPKKVINYHNRVFDYVDSKDKKSMATNKKDTKENDENSEDLQETLEDMEYKEIKEFVKENGLDFKVKKSDWEDEPDEIAEKIVELLKEKEEAAPDTTESDDTDDLEDTLEDMDYKTFKAYVKENDLELTTKIKKSSFDDDQEELIKEVMELMAKKSGKTAKPAFDEDALTEQLEKMSYKEAKAYCKTNELGYKPKKSDWEDDPEDDVEEIVKLMKAKTETTVETEKPKTDKADKPKKEKSTKEEKPKGNFKAGSVQEKFLERINEGNCKIIDLAVILNGGKKKEAEKKCNAVCHKLARQFANKAPVTVTWTGTTVDEGVVTLVE